MQNNNISKHIFLCLQSDYLDSINGFDDCGMRVVIFFFKPYI